MVTRVNGAKIEVRGLGNIQGELHKVEQFHKLWNSSTICGTVPLCVGILESCQGLTLRT